MLALLRQDHRKVAGLFEQFEAAKDPRRKQTLFRSIKDELDTHAQLEEELFYPRAEDQGEKKLRAEVEEAHGEHDKMKEMLREAEGLDPESGEFDATVAGLKGAVEHHVEEEEGAMFEHVRQAFTQEDLVEMGRQLKARRNDLAAGSSPRAGRGLVGKLMGR